jgi:hypothetical protein
MVCTTLDLSSADTIPAMVAPLAPTIEHVESAPPALPAPPSRLEALREFQRKKIRREAGLTEDCAPLQEGDTLLTSLPPQDEELGFSPHKQGMTPQQVQARAQLDHGVSSVPVGAPSPILPAALPLPPTGPVKRPSSLPSNSAIGKLFAAWNPPGTSRSAPREKGTPAKLGNGGILKRRRLGRAPVRNAPGTLLETGSRPSSGAGSGPAPPPSSPSLDVVAGNAGLPPCSSSTSSAVVALSAPPRQGPHDPPLLPWQRDSLTVEEAIRADMYIGMFDKALTPGCPLGQDLVDRCLAAFISRLRRVSRQTGLTPLGRQDSLSVGIITSFQAGTLMDASRWSQDADVRAKHRASAQQKAMRTIASHDITIFPFVFHNHWVGLVFHCPPHGRRGPRTLVAHLVNSIDGYGEMEIWETIEQMFECPSATRYGFSTDAGRKCPYLRVETRQQGRDNSSDCGVLMLHTIFSMILEGTDFLLIPQTSCWKFQDLRRWLALLLLDHDSPQRSRTRSGLLSVDPQGPGPPPLGGVATATREQSEGPGPPLGVRGTSPLRKVSPS